MKRKNGLLLSALSDASLLVLYMLSKWILKWNHLAYMNRVSYILNIVAGFLIVAVIIQTILLLYRVKMVDTIKKLKCMAFGAGMGVITFFVFVSVVGESFFGYPPEHIVEKDGKIMVAYVHSFLQVNVYYYEYVNPIVRGNQMKINEDYGNGGYDPFEKAVMPEVQRYAYYDDNGKVIASNWLNVN